MGLLSFILFFVISTTIIMVVVVTTEWSKASVAEKKVKMCHKNWECSLMSMYCCNDTISDLFKDYQFDDLFSKRNAPTANAVGFWDYGSFIVASAQFQPLGFGTTGGKLMQMKEIAAFLAFVGARTSCGYGVAVGGPLAWGLCYNREMSPGRDYCDRNANYQYRCASGALYYGRGAIPIYGNKLYGMVGKGLNVDLLNHPELLEQNATLAFMAAMWMWMTPLDHNATPSAHDAFVAKWKPTKHDVSAKRIAGFGTTISILYGDSICNKGDVEAMNTIISHYLYYLDLMGVGRESETEEELTCVEQLPFKQSYNSFS